METQKMDRIYEEIANKLVTIIPEEWKKIYLYVEIGHGYKIMFFYYYPLADKEPVYSLDIPDKFVMDEEKFNDLENDLLNLFSALQSGFVAQHQEKWTNLTYMLDNTGAMNVRLGYQDLSQIDPVEKQEQWEATYLK
ncbi:immunity protein YezG family protein [Heyndrickxia coagulans]|uniref:immunity protein YezG family protein n=1 Tax=Heyndrickxia coagulans TaxID=1398 RepID=UPI0015C62343|nr:immunity protein YezG family protein [Heyndrickxia coagulans]